MLRTELFSFHSWESGQVKGESLFWEFMSPVEEISFRNHRINLPDRKKDKLDHISTKKIVTVFPLRE